MRVDFPPGQFDLGRCLASGQVFRWKKLPDGRRLGADGDRWYCIRQTSESQIDGESNATGEEFRSLFRLDWDSDQIHQEALQCGPEIAPYLAPGSGLRLMRLGDPTETLFSFMCSANNHLLRIGPMVEKLSMFGPLLFEREGVRLHRFPDVSTLAQIDPAALRDKGFGYRAETIPAAAREVERRGGEKYLFNLKGATYETAHNELRSLPFIGRKLADCTALFGLDHTEAVPVDTHIWQVAVRLYYPEWAEAGLTDLKYRTISQKFRERFGKLAGWVQQILFVDNMENARARRAGMSK